VSDAKIRITVWGENVHDRKSPIVAKIYPDGMHSCIARALAGPGMEARTATLDQPEHGLTEEVLESTDVLTWWGHAAHGQVDDAIVSRVHRRVLEGMGLIVLHSGHYSKIFKRLMGTSCSLKWREAGERERVWVVDPSHPIAAGVGECIELENSEMYGEPFGIPVPDEQVFISWFEGGEVFRSGCCYRRGAGRVFYFSPGHETYPIYWHPKIQLVLRNACQWAAPHGRRIIDSAPNVPIEDAREKLTLKGETIHAPGQAGFR
jgi:trehalose utilization protein